MNTIRYEVVQLSPCLDGWVVLSIKESSWHWAPIAVMALAKRSLVSDKGTLLEEEMRVMPLVSAEWSGCFETPDMAGFATLPGAWEEETYLVLHWAKIREFFEGEDLSVRIPSLNDYLESFEK